MTCAELVLEYVRALIWPITVFSIILLFKKQIFVILGRLRKAGLPGGVSLDFEKGVDEVTQLSEKVESIPRPQEKKGTPSIPLTEANARLIKLGLQPSPSGLDMNYYRNIAKQDPNLALAGLRMEIDVLARNLAYGFNVDFDERDSGNRLIKILYDADAISYDQYDLIKRVFILCNAAIHGTPVAKFDADGVINSAEVLAEQFLDWLSWGFDDNWKPGTKK